MIDLDVLDQQLEAALDEDLRAVRRAASAVSAPRVVAPAERTVESAPAPADPPRPRLSLPTFEESGPAAHGHIDGVKRETVAHAANRREAAAWSTMQALLEGRERHARTGVERLRMLASAVRDADGLDGYWLQRFSLALEWGSDEERYAVLDHCREQAYRYQDLSWRGRLSLLLARLGRTDEASREVETTVQLLDDAARDEVWLDVATNVAEAAAVLGDARAAGVLARWLAKEENSTVVVGRGWVCKGSLARYRALLAATVGNSGEADTQFGVAVDAHRALGARPLLARTLDEWGGCLSGRDDVRARRCLEESARVAAELEILRQGG